MKLANRPFLYLLLSLLCGCSPVGSGESGAAEGPHYEDGNALVLPQDYRSWPFLGAGLGLTYAEGGTAAGNQQLFTQVFVDPQAYAGFMETGRWPGSAIFILEFRAPASQVSINQSGSFASDLVRLEAEVKDARFDDGWAYFDFGSARDGFLRVASPHPPERAAPCIECHSDHGAVERTFVQFYPTLFDVAREKGTLKSDY